MIDISKDTLLTLREAISLLPRHRAGQPVSFSCVWRWAVHGVRGIKLETLRVGGGLCTTAKALQTFCEQLTAQAGGRRTNQQPRPEGRSEESTARDRKARHAAAQKRLAASGV
jgi:hypothetical protein